MNCQISETRLGYNLFGLPKERRSDPFPMMRGFNPQFDNLISIHSRDTDDTHIRLGNEASPTRWPGLNA